MAAPAEDGGIAADMTTPSSTSRRPEDLDRTWSAWKAALARDRRIGSRRVLAVDIDDKHARLLQADGSIPRSARRKPFLSQLWVPVALVTTLAVGPAAYVVTVEFDTCQWGIKRVETGECIGVGVDGFSFDQRLKPVTDRIDANNKKVLKSGNPHVTVYHLGGFSVPKDSAAGDGDLLADAHGELMGALLLQERLIDNSADRTIPLLQLLPVNAGSAYRYASDAVDAMLEQLDQHSNVIGVIGANESREPVKQALKKLSSRALPVITTSATYDDLSKVDGNYLPNVFPLAPPNTELAAHTAHWAKVGIPGALNQAKNVVVLMDDTENDLYTSDLGERFRVAFGAGARKATFSGADSIRPNVERICREMTPRPDLIFYAGRSTQFGEFHDAASNACHGITVIAGDAVTQFINDRISQLAEPRVKLFYTPLASEHSWSKVPQINQTDFYQSAF